MTSISGIYKAIYYNDNYFLLKRMLESLEISCE